MKKKGAGEKDEEVSEEAKAGEQIEDGRRSGHLWGLYRGGGRRAEGI